MKLLNNQSRGFTLLELLIVIAIIAILAAFLIWVLNPAETLRKARGSQRMSDLKTLHRALALYITVVSNPDLDGSVIFQECEDSSGSPHYLLDVYGQAYKIPAKYLLNSLATVSPYPILKGI